VVEESFDLGGHPLPGVLVGELGNPPNEVFPSFDRFGLQAL
jgi:hypothetical protein